MKLSIEPRTLRFRSPVVTANGTLRERELLQVGISDDSGLTGWGEAAPLEPYDGVSMRTVRAALEAYRPILEHGAHMLPGDRLLAAREAADVPQALAAIDLALWDLRGRRDGRPVSSLLARDAAPTVEVNATIASEDRGGAAAAAAEAARSGFRTVKVKVGLGDDAGRVAAVRAAIGPEVALRLDANGAWRPNDAVANISALAAAGLELVEEPTRGLVELSAVRDRVAVRIAMDESAAQPGALLSGAADAVCLKISRSGGISSLLADAVAVRTTGADVYLASTFDGPLGIAAALHTAAALSPMPACGLATLALFEDFGGVLPAVDGEIRVPDGPGLGVEPLR